VNLEIDAHQKIACLISTTFRVRPIRIASRGFLCRQAHSGITVLKLYDIKEKLLMQSKDGKHAVDFVPTEPTNIQWDLVLEVGIFKQLLL